MKILLISPRTTGIGGVAQHVRKLRSLLLLNGHYVDVISTENTPHIPVKGMYNTSFAVTSFMKSFLNEKSYDVVHAHNFPSWPAASVANARKKIITLHGAFAIQEGELHGHLVDSIARRIENIWSKRPDLVTCISLDATRYYSRISKRAVWVPNAIDPREMPTEGIRLAKYQACYVGRLSREKGIDVLLDAMKYIDSSIKVVVIGSGNSAAVVRAAKLYDNLIFLGYKSREETLKLIKGSDSLLIPSRLEGMPTVMLEAMALGVPVIASAIRPLLDISEHFVKVEPGNPERLAKAVNASVFNADPSIVEKARKDVMQKYTWEKVLALYLKAYEDDS
ncbi:MAG: glycosyltransferase family 4 protein [Conexivisphaerales archaeon]